MIVTGIGPVFAFRETLVKRVFTVFSIGAGCPDGAAPPARSRTGGKAQAIIGSTSSAPNTTKSPQLAHAWRRASGSKLSAPALRKPRARRLRVASGIS